MNDMKYDKSFPKSAKGMHAWTKIHFCFLKQNKRDFSPAENLEISL